MPRRVTITNGCPVRAYIGQPTFIQVWDVGLGRLLRDNGNGTYSIVTVSETRLTPEEALDWIDDHAG
jgi:hypothetical protein